MEMIGKRNPFEADYTVGFDNTGKLLGVSIDYYIDCGCYMNDSLGTMQAAMSTCDNAYYCPNWLVTPYIAITNTASNTACRGPGCCPAIFIMETIVEHVAKVLQVSPAVVRFGNLYQEGQVTPYGQPLLYCSLTSIWESLLASSNYTARSAAVDSFNQANRWKKRGISIAPNKFEDLVLTIS
jgi:xanthine dehydrogenase/oxidase